MTKHTVHLNDGDELDLFASPAKLREVLDTANRRAHRHFINGKPGTVPPPVEPPPTGEVLAFFTNEPGDFEQWQFVPDAPSFEQGRSKSHDVPPPAIVGSFDLRMKYANGKPDGGLFQPGQRGIARRTFTVKPGARTLRLIGVAHDEGDFRVRIIDETAGAVAGEWTGTGAWNENEYLWRNFDFNLSGENVTLEIDYTAPGLGSQSGVKIGYGEIT